MKIKSKSFVFAVHENKDVDINDHPKSKEIDDLLTRLVCKDKVPWNDIKVIKCMTINERRQSLIYSTNILWPE